MSTEAENIPAENAGTLPTVVETKTEITAPIKRTRARNVHPELSRFNILSNKPVEKPVLDKDLLPEDLVLEYEVKIYGRERVVVHIAKQRAVLLRGMTKEGHYGAMNYALDTLEKAVAQLSGVYNEFIQKEWPKRKRKPYANDLPLLEGISERPSIDIMAQPSGVMPEPPDDENLNNETF